MNPDTNKIGAILGKGKAIGKNQRKPCCKSAK